jgi:biotin carboxylase
MQFQSVAFLGLGLNQLEYVQAAKNLGYYIIGFDGDENAVCKNLCDESYNLRIDNHQDIVEILKNYENLTGCISEQTDNALMSIGVVNSAFNLLGPSLNVVKSIKDKLYQRIKCRELGVEQPNFCFYKSKQNFFSVAKTFITQYQNMVIKPCEGQSSIGVISVSRKELLNCNYEELFENLSELSGTKSFLVEEFVGGDDISIEGFVYQSQVHVLAISHKTKFENNPMVDKILKVMPYAKDKHKSEYQLAEKLIKGFNLNNSFFHIEAKKNGDSLSLIEWTPRGCGARLSSILLSKMYGENIPAIRIGMLKNNYELPILKSPINEGLLQFFDHEILNIESLNSNIQKYTKDYVLYINNRHSNHVLDKHSLADARSRPGSIIAIGSKNNLKSLSIQIGNL